QPHAEDSRVVLLALTAAGRDLHHALYEEQIQRMGLLLARLSPDEQRTFLDLLERATTPVPGNSST
ncbi:MAG: MarR family transcriptional regulator, partial [Chloroflexales bacterium]|nr:MarR family transcriptional regulator [Chloroflexales bacterium]